MESKKEVYPINSTAKQYHDADGNPTTLYRLVLEEPDWAMSRIKAGEQAIAQRDELLGVLKYAKLYLDCGKSGVALDAINSAIAKCEVKS